MDILLAFTSVTVFTLMLTIGVNQSPGQIMSLWHQWAVLLRALVAVVVLVPTVVILLLWIFDLPPYVATALAVISTGPRSAFVTTTFTRPLQPPGLRA